MKESPEVEEIGTEEDIRKLLNLAGPRLQPPAGVEARVRAATLAAVESLPARNSETNSRWPALGLAVAATLMLGLMIGYLTSRPSSATGAGIIVFATGAYTVRGSEADDEQLPAGAIVRTSAGARLLIDLGEGRMLRMDRNASLTLHDSSEIWLHHGRVYVDSTEGVPLTVVAPNASITDIGTQFEVTVDDELLIVATREGVLNVVLGSNTLLSKAEPGMGEALKIDGLELLFREEIPTSGERWAWTQLARPQFNARERSIRDYLNWAARENGKRLRFATPLAEQQAELRILHATGDIDADVGTMQRVLATSAFETRAGEDHEIIVALKSDG